MTSSKSSHNLLTLESLTAQYILVCHVRMAPNPSLLVASEPLAENIHLSSFEFVGASIQNQCIINIHIYFWVFTSILSILFFMCLSTHHSVLIAVAL